MVIVHLSTNLRRIISPNKNETLDQLFKRFCREFGYRESEYEFQSYPEDIHVPLDLNINANRIKEVSLVQKRVSRRNSDESSYAVIRDPSSVISDNRKRIAASVPVAIPPEIITGSEQVTDNIKLKKQPKRNAPRAPVINDNINNDKNESKVPDFDIPPPPEFMPQEETTENEPFYRSVQCETKECSPDLSRETGSSDDVREASDSYLHPPETFDGKDNITESDDEDIKEDKADDKVINVNHPLINSESVSETESSVEDVYKDEDLLGNYKYREKLEVKTQTFGEKSDDKSDEINNNELMTEPIEKMTNVHEWKHPDPVSLKESVQLNCPIAEMEETDIKSINSSNIEHLSDSDDHIDSNVVENHESQVDRKEEIDINSKSTDRVDSRIKYEDSLSFGENNKTNSQNAEIIDETPKPRIRVKSAIKCNTASYDSSEVLEMPRSQSVISPETPEKILCEHEDVSFEDGHPTDFPITILSEPSNPKFYWELPKQSKTIQIMSRAYNTIDIPEPKVVKKIEQRSAPPAAQKPTKEVKVTVQESPSDQTGGPTYRPRQPKTLCFTAAAKDSSK